MDQPWTQITDEQPKQGQRILVKMIGGQVRITTYDKYCYDHWPILAWKTIFNEQRQPTNL